MDVSNQLLCKLLKDAAKVAKNYDYMIACNPVEFCSDASDYFAYTLAPACNEDVQRYIERKYKKLPGVTTTTSTTQTNCDIDVQDITPTVTCSTITIQVLQ